MRKALTAGIVLAGVLSVSVMALAEGNIKAAIPEARNTAAKAQVQKPRPPEPPEGFDGKRPPMMSRDMNGQRPPMPPDGKRPPRMSGDKRPPMPPRSGDRRPPEFDGQPRRSN